MKYLKIGSRKSDLARWQAYEVAARLKQNNPDLKVEFVFKSSLGDQRTDLALRDLPEKGVFTEDFVEDLKTGRVDLVVHSWKDLPTDPRPFTEIAATIQRADVRDVLLLKKSVLLEIRDSELSRTLKISTSSPRRAYNLGKFFKWALPFHAEKVDFVDIRGNIPTRLSKLRNAEVDGLILAKAALDRLLSGCPVDPETHLPFENLSHVQTEILSIVSLCEWMILPLIENPAAAAQGALAIEVARHRPEIKDLVRSIQNEQVFREVSYERDILRSYGGGCHQKIGVSHFEKPYGAVTFLKGLTDAGEVLNRFDLIPKTPWSAPERWEYCWPLQSNTELFERFDRPVLEVQNDLQERIAGSRLGCWVSKAEAFKLDIFRRGPGGELMIGTRTISVVWASGLKTWKKLAEQGIWVHGSSESLGEERPSLDDLAPDLSWFKLSHDSAPDNVRFPVIATYRLKPRVDEGLSLLGKTHFFWASGSAFELVSSKFPEIISQGFHFCGPGNTWQNLKSKISQDRLFIALDWAQWAADMKGSSQK